jgi:bifunctional DNase/RNase
VCERDGIEQAIDARTSDAIALALRFAAPIFTYPNILEKAGVYLNPNRTSDEDELADDILVPLQENENRDEETPTSVYAKHSIVELYEFLDTAIQQEDYEKAAHLRDEISKREDKNLNHS